MSKIGKPKKMLCPICGQYELNLSKVQEYCHCCGYALDKKQLENPQAKNKYSELTIEEEQRRFEFQHPYLSSIFEDTDEGVYLGALGLDLDSQLNLTTSHITFRFAIRFKEGYLHSHFKKYGEEFGIDNELIYNSEAVRFANYIDPVNARGIVDFRGLTYKYNMVSKVLVVVDPEGFIYTYRHFNDGFFIANKRGEKVWIKI